MRPLVFTLFLILIGCTNDLDEKKIEANPAFAMNDNLKGKIVQSTDEESIGKTIAFINLTSDEPKVLLSYGMTYELKKIFENENTLTLTLAKEPVNGGVDIFVIDKKTGKFSRAEAGSVNGVYSSSSLGVLE